MNVEKPKTVFRYMKMMYQAHCNKKQGTLALCQRAFLENPFFKDIR